MVVGPSQHIKAIPTDLFQTAFIRGQPGTAGISGTVTVPVGDGGFDVGHTDVRLPQKIPDGVEIPVSHGKGFHNQDISGSGHSNAFFHVVFTSL